jgi:chromate transporter
LPPLLAATIGALGTTWTTFTPCFLRVDYDIIRRYCSGSRPVLNLAVWFGLHVIFPGDGTVDSFAILVGTVAFIGMVHWKWDIIPVCLVRVLQA